MKMPTTRSADDSAHRGQPAPVGELLRFWRGRRGLSQLDLALQGGTSQRHLSFVESGRSVPGRKWLVMLSEVLDLPYRERNALLLAAGYAPVYAEAAIDDATMHVVLQSLDQMLQNHEPHPALVMDRYWNVIRTNSAAPRFFGTLIDLEAFAKPRNLLDLIFNPAGLRPHIEDWEVVAAGLLQRVRREALGLVIDTKLQAVLDHVRRYPGTENLPLGLHSEGPILPITFRRGHERISYFSLVTTIGSPQTVTAQEMRLECLFPLQPLVKTAI